LRNENIGMARPRSLIFIRVLWFSIFLFTITQCRERITLPPSDPDNGGLFLPGGFEAVVVADSTGRARHIAVNDNGDIYVKLTYNDKLKGAGGTVGLRDTDKDGKADTIVYFGDYIDEGYSAVGVTIHNGFLYTSTVRQVLRNKLTPGKLIPESKAEVVLTDTDENVVRNWHTTKPLAFDDKGNMFVPFGSPSDACQDIIKFGPTGIPGGKGLDPCPELENHAGIWKFDASKINLTLKDGIKYSTGIRSVVGMQWNPEDGHVYAVVNGIDNFHTMFPDLYSSWQAAVLPSETLIKVTEGSNFGWPYAYYDHMAQKNIVQPGYGGDGKKVADQYDLPLIGFPGHWAPMDVLFYQGDQFPERYKNGAFIAFHGSTDRSPFPQAGYIVCFIPFENGKPFGKWEVFADGFTGVDTVINTNDAAYRPMGLATGPDGSLYISESNKGKIWRVMYKDEKQKFDDSALAEIEKRKTRSYIKAPDEVADNLHRGDELEGSILYNTYCAACHQRNGKGDNPQNKHLDDHAIASILTYIRMNFGNNASEVSARTVNRMRQSSSRTE